MNTHLMMPIPLQNGELNHLMKSEQNLNEDRVGWIPVSEKLPTDDCLAVYKTSYGRCIIIKAFYAKEFEVQQNYDDCVDLDYCETTEDYFLKAGWYECISNWDEYSSVVVNDGDITHWMPMPELPDECGIT